MHLKVKYVEDIWDHDPGVDLADVTLQLGELDLKKTGVIKFDKDLNLKQNVITEDRSSVNSPNTSITEPGDSKPTAKMNTFPRTKKHSHDEFTLNQRKRRFFHNYSFNFKKHKQLKEKISAAIERKNIFSIVGTFPALRRALKSRNWLEKQTYKSALAQDLSMHSLLHKAQEGNEFEEALISKILRPHNADFIWQNRHLKESKKDRFYTPYRSRIYYDRGFDFTMKEGLVKVHESIQWYQEDGIAEVDCPRTHLLDSEEAITRFLEDFQLTACTSFLYHLSKYLDSLFEEDGVTSVDIIHTAMKLFKYHLACVRHEDIDYQEYCEPLLTPEDRSTISAVLYGGARFKILPGYEILSLIAQVKKLVLEASKHFPDMKIDGVRNMWILKPGNRCRGLGIMLFNDDRKLLDYVDSNSDMKYIAQKYIEKPLLIHNTKFDIRQYFLITFTGNQLKVWMYRDCYLRFSSREFNLDDFNEVIHLTNYSIQKYYAGVTRKPDCPLPACNMWSSKQFEQYLQSLDKGYYWEHGMKMERNMFELYGADFMVTENFRTMLIEINSSPDLSSSTEVTEIICPAVLEDLVKVVIDNTNDKRAGTGLFECIFCVEIPRLAPYGYGMILEGKSLGPKIRCRSPLAPTGPPMCSLNRSRTGRTAAAMGSTPPASKRSSATSTASETPH
ncbi:tubulin glycylase 3B-like isoform X4 [Wyeomyia smithii]|uniref:tubulin glycylase 3B-like isoform X4 n=1 Tax=Wyeomyia smithii TaxID=174621 RepID=UPI002467F230|nr:tubulin glycylase 3B-like isoform X4 [Wyeomyia smithii]